MPENSQGRRKIAEAEASLSAASEVGFWFFLAEIPILIPAAQSPGSQIIQRLNLRITSVFSSSGSGAVFVVGSSRSRCAWSRKGCCRAPCCSC